MATFLIRIRWPGKASKGLRPATTRDILHSSFAASDIMSGSNRVCEVTVNGDIV